MAISPTPPEDNSKKYIELTGMRRPIDSAALDYSDMNLCQDPAIQQVKQDLHQISAEQHLANLLSRMRRIFIDDTKKINGITGGNTLEIEQLNSQQRQELQESLISCLTRLTNLSDAIEAGKYSDVPEKQGNALLITIANKINTYTSLIFALKAIQTGNDTEFSRHRLTTTIAFNSFTNWLDKTANNMDHQTHNVLDQNQDALRHLVGGFVSSDQINGMSDNHWYVLNQLLLVFSKEIERISVLNGRFVPGIGIVGSLSANPVNSSFDRYPNKMYDRDSQTETLVNILKKLRSSTPLDMPLIEVIEAMKELVKKMADTNNKSSDGIRFNKRTVEAITKLQKKYLANLEIPTIPIFFKEAMEALIHNPLWFRNVRSSSPNY